MNVSDSTLGPPDSLKGVIAQNGVQYGGIANSVGAGGTITNSTIYGSGFGNAANEGTAVLLYGAKNVTLSNDTITGAGTDLGVAVATDTFDTPNVPSTGITISHNHIERTAPDSPDTFGIGVDADPSNVSVTDVRAAAQVTASADPSPRSSATPSAAGRPTSSVPRNRSASPSPPPPCPTAPSRCPTRPR